MLAQLLAAWISSLGVLNLDEWNRGNPSTFSQGGTPQL